MPSKDPAAKREEARLRAQKWRANNLERERARARAYASSHRAEACARAAAWAKVHPKRAKGTHAFICQQCGDTFLSHPSRLKTGRGQYCSRRCKGLASRVSPEHRRASLADWRARNAEKLRARSAAFRLTHRKEIAARTAKHRALRREEIRARIAAYYADHREALLAYQVAYRAAHPAEVSARTAAWRKAHPEKKLASNQRRRAWKAGAAVNDFTAAQWIALQAAYDHRCAYCRVRAKGHLTMDHLTPLSQGGSHTLANIVPACVSCNCRKKDGPVRVPVQPLLLTA